MYRDIPAVLVYADGKERPVALDAALDGTSELFRVSATVTEGRATGIQLVAWYFSPRLWNNFMNHGHEVHLRRHDPTTPILRRRSF